MAARFWVGGNGNWDNTAGLKWALTSGGVGGQAVPTNADDVTLDNSLLTGNVTITVTSVCKSLNCTGYVNTLAGSSQLTVSGSVTFVAGMTLTYSGTMIVNGTSTLTSNGQTFPGNLTLSVAGTLTVTMGDNWIISGNFAVLLVTTSVINLNNNQITVGGNLTCPNNGTFSSSGTGTSFVLNGNGTWSNGSAHSFIKHNVTINTAGTINITGTLSYGQGTLAYTTGTVNVSGSTLAINQGGNTTINTSGMAWNNVSMSVNSSVITLSSDLNLSGILTLGTSGTSSTVTVNGAFNINTPSLTLIGNTTTHNAGTATIVINGSGTLTGSTTSVLEMNLTFNSTATTISGTLRYNANKTLRWIAGTMTVTGSILEIDSTCTINTSTMNWQDVSIIGGTITVTLSSDLNLLGVLTLGATTLTTTINGLFNINCAGNLTQTGTSSTIAGTSTIVLNGTSIITQSSGCAMRLNMTLSGAITLSGTFLYLVGTMIISGTLVTTGSNLQLSNSCTLTINTSGIIFNTLSIQPAATLTMTINGTNGFTMANFSYIPTSTGGILNWKSTNVYIITATFTLTGTSASNIVFSASTPTSRYKITVNQGATVDVGYVNCTDADSSSGITIGNYKGIDNNTLNWLAPTNAQPTTSSYSSVIS